MGAANVEPAPLIEPDAPPELEPPELPVFDLLSSLEPHADTPSARTTAATGASQVRDLNGFSFVVVFTPPRLPSLGGESVTGVWRPCEKAVKALDGSGSRSRSGCG